jgi:hypothetical protein
VLDKRLECHLAVDHLLKPNAHLDIVETRIDVDISVDLQESHAGDVARAFVAIDKRVIESNSNHIQRRLGDHIRALIVCGILWPL